jgi:hypothetical protein
MLAPCHGLDSLSSSMKNLQRGSKPRLHDRRRLSRCLQRKRLPRQWPMSKRGRRTKPPTRSTSAPARPFRWRQWRIGSGAGVRRTNCRFPRRASPLPDKGKNRYGTAPTLSGASWCLAIRTRSRHVICRRAIACRSTRSRSSGDPARLSRVDRSLWSSRLHHSISHRSPPQRGRDYAAVAWARATKLESGRNDRAGR